MGRRYTAVRPSARQNVTLYCLTYMWWWVPTPIFVVAHVWCGAHQGVPLVPTTTRKHTHTHTHTTARQGARPRGDARPLCCRPSLPALAPLLYTSPGSTAPLLLPRACAPSERGCAVTPVVVAPVAAAAAAAAAASAAAAAAGQVAASQASQCQLWKAAGCGQPAVPRAGGQSWLAITFAYSTVLLAAGGRRAGRLMAGRRRLGWLWLAGLALAAGWLHVATSMISLATYLRGDHKATSSTCSFMISS